MSQPGHQTPTQPEMTMKVLLLIFFFISLVFVSTVEPRFTATSVIRSARYYGYFFWPPGKTTIHFIVFSPLMTVLTGFHCSSTYGLRH